MKILQINSVCGVGSTGRIVQDLSTAIQSNGSKCVIAYGREPSKTAGFNTIKIGSNFDIYKHVFYSRLTDKSGFASTGATKRFIENVKIYDPDIVHLHNVHGYYINIELLFNYLKKSAVPIVWTLHDCWSFTGHCAYFDYAECNLWKTECSDNCPQKKAYPKSLFFSRAEPNFERKKNIFTSVKKMTIVTPSDWLAKLVKESYLSEYPIQVINNGIDIDAFKPLKSNFREKNNLKDKFIILGVASVWDQRKGLKDFIKLSNMVDDRFRIVLVGLDNKQLKTLPKNIIGIRITSCAEELVKIYTASDVFFNPTYEDNYPTVNLESISCGTPVITYNTGGSPETFKNSNNGFIVKKGDISMVKEILFRLLDNPIVIENAQAYDKNITYNKYFNLYKKSVENK